jgi:hypothetical protein
MSLQHLMFHLRLLFNHKTNLWIKKVLQAARTSTNTRHILYDKKDLSAPKKYNRKELYCYQELFGCSNQENWDEQDM